MKKYLIITAAMVVMSAFCEHVHAQTLNDETALKILRGENPHSSNNPFGARGGITARDRIDALRHFIANDTRRRLNLNHERRREVFDIAVNIMRNPALGADRDAAFLIFQLLHNDRIFENREHEDLQRFFTDAMLTVLRGGRDRWFDIVFNVLRDEGDWNFLRPDLQEELRKEIRRHQQPPRAATAPAARHDSMNDSMQSMWDSQSMDSQSMWDESMRWERESQSMQSMWDSQSMVPWQRDPIDSQSMWDESMRWDSMRQQSMQSMWDSQSMDSQSMWDESMRWERESQSMQSMWDSQSMVPWQRDPIDSQSMWDESMRWDSMRQQSMQSMWDSQSMDSQSMWDESMRWQQSMDSQSMWDESMRWQQSMWDSQSMDSMNSM